MAASIPPYLNSFFLAFKELQNLISDAAFTRLCSVFGGTGLFVSNSDNSRERLTIIVGAENAEKMAFHFNGVKLILSRLSSLKIKERHQAIVEDAEKGMSCRDIAIKYELTDRQVRRIARKLLKPRMSLFGCKHPTYQLMIYDLKESVIGILFRGSECYRQDVIRPELISLATNMLWTYMQEEFGKPLRFNTVEKVISGEMGFFLLAKSSPHIAALCPMKSGRA